MQYWLFFCFSLTLQNLSSQDSFQFLDIRDSTSYAIVRIGDDTWFQENIRYQTPGCFCQGRKAKKKLCQVTNYYPYTELQEVCPSGWHVATLNEWEAIIEIIKEEHHMNPSLIRYDTLFENGSIIINSDEFLLMENQTSLKFHKIGWVQGNKIQQKQNTTMWINNESIDDDRYHIHYGNTGYVKHTHKHNMDDKKKKTRRFAIRCVKDKKSPHD